MIVQFLRRAAAYLIDSILVRVFIRPETFISGWLGDVVAIILTAIYIVGCHWRWGRTIGKRLLGLRVATIAGFSPPPFGPALLRFLPMLVVGNLAFTATILNADRLFTPLFDFGRWRFDVFHVTTFAWLLSEVVLAVRTGGFRSAHDLIAGTVVTNERDKKTAEQGARANAPRCHASC